MPAQAVAAPAQYDLEHSLPAWFHPAAFKIGHSRRPAMNQETNLGIMRQTVTRRQVVAGLAVGAFGGLTLQTNTALAATEEQLSHSQESIHQETVFKANRKRVYEALTDTEQFDKIIQLSPEMQAGRSLGTSPTAISREPGGTFSIFGGHIIGRQIELIPNDRIVQAWRVVDWDPGVYSIAKFQLIQQGTGTKLTFDHTGFPRGQAEHLAEGWKSHYWDSLEKFLA
jgi:activator of HSP90 ATPase